MKQCPYCGSELADDAKFCGECGKSLPAEEPVTAPVEAPVETPVEVPVETPVEAAAEPAPVPVAVPEQPAAEMPVITQVPPKKQMLSTFQYVVLSLLYAIPVIGLIFLFIFGAGHPKNGSLKRFSAALLILRLVFWIVVLTLLIVAMIKNGRFLTDALGQLIPAVENLLKAIFA
ncbi:MAG: zinc-ribbon domain-containing protein [Clostridia bacterium]|nr:zinc-ribbon domain-containing protein [Clostridia bacterium]